MLNLEVKLISIKIEFGKNEYLKHSHSKVCWSVEKFHSEPQGVVRMSSRDGGSESVSDSCYLDSCCPLVVMSHLPSVSPKTETADCSEYILFR